VKIRIEDTNLIKISEIFTKSLQAEIAETISKNNLTEHLVGFFESETHLHTQRVSDFARLIAIYLELSDKQIAEICEVAPFHDLGKLATPQHILAAPRKLTSEEFLIIKEHSGVGFELLQNRGHAILDLAAIVAHEHHEKWNGEGYPRGLKGDKIHLYARIVAGADVLDALLSRRCYKTAWKKSDIYDFFNDQTGKHFDPQVGNIIVNYFEEFYAYNEKTYYCQDLVD